MKFGLMFFASSEEALSGNKYRLVMESARFADENGFSSVWLPERHFTEFGSLYPNPAVLHAALAASTTRVRLLAGSVVVPLHHPLRIAEEWSMVDNLSNGRVGISFAPGWNPDDFAFCPEKYSNRQEEILAGIQTVQHLWRGGKLDAYSGNGNPIQVRIYPTPVQRELPIWLTAAGNPKTFTRAGEIGANLLTHLLDQDEDQLRNKIALYRTARAKSGFDPETATVTVMLHTFVGSDAALVREQARAPFCGYIRSNIGLLNGLAQSRGQQVDVRSMPAGELDVFVQFLYERFAQSRGLIGTPESCIGLVRRLEAIGVDEVACLLDFGPPVELILRNLPHLARLRDLYRSGELTAEAPFDPAVVQARCPEQIPGEVFNQEIRSFGIHIDGEFQCIERLWRGVGEALALVRIPSPAASAKYLVHPAFLDACSRVLAAAIERSAIDGGGFYLPNGVGELRLLSRPAEGLDRAWSHAKVRRSFEGFEGDVLIYDSAGRLLIEVLGVRLQKLDAEEKTSDFAQSLYRRVWKRNDSESLQAAASPGEWLILADRGGVGERVAALMEQLGNRCILAYADSAPRGNLLAGHSWSGVIHLWSLDNSRFQADGVLWILGALAPGQARLWLVTAGAVPVLEGEAPAVEQSPIWGLGRAIAVEHSTIWGGLIDLDPADLSASEVLHAIRASGREDMVAFRRGQSYGARLVRNESRLKLSAPLRFRQDASYLVTGGFGGLGVRLISWLRAQGAGSIAVLGRNIPESIPAGLRAFRGDVAQLEDVKEAIREIEHSMPPLKGIFHLAGALDDALLVDQDAERFHRAAAAKIEGAWNLHLLAGAAPLDYFVMFSSMASLVAMPGQGNYAAANSFLDALAHLRRAQGKVGLSINWGPWSEIGHAATDYGRRAHEGLAAMGIDSLSPDFALAALQYLLEREAVQTGVAHVDWGRLFEKEPAAAESPLLSEFAGARLTVPQQEAPLMADLRSCAPDNRLELTNSLLSKMLADILRLPAGQSIAPRRSLFDAGLDSILALELTSRISAGFGLPFRATLFFTHPTLEAVADHILREVLPPREEEPAKASENQAGEGEPSEDELAELIAWEIAQK